MTLCIILNEKGDVKLRNYAIPSPSELHCFTGEKRQDINSTGWYATQKGKTACMDISGPRGLEERAQESLPKHSSYVKRSQDSKYDGSVDSGNNKDLLQLTGPRRGNKH